MKRARKQYKGFSLTELLIVIAIISIAATLSWKMLADSKKRTQVDSACESVAVMANKARGYALSGINNADKVRMKCVAASCQVEKWNLPTPAWVSVDSKYDLQNGVKFNSSGLDQNGPPKHFNVEYSIPYAGLPIGTGDKTLESGSFTKKLKIDAFKAVCTN